MHPMAKRVECQHCGYTWDTESKAQRVSCSRCKSSITMFRLTKAKEPIDVKSIDLLLSLKIIDSLKFLKAKSWAKTNGEDYIPLKVNMDGILSL